MALFNRFPFSNAHELNLDWILRKIKELEDAQSGSSIEPSSNMPADLGTPSPGSSDKYSRGDHRHARPTYTKSEVGLGNVDNVQQYSASNPPPYPVTSVAGKTGAVTLDAEDVEYDPADAYTSGTVGHIITKINTGIFYTTPENFGAKGDGITDDTTAFSSAFATRLPVYLRSDAVYLLSDGFNIADDTIIYGNNAKLLINSYTGTGNFQYHFLRGATGTTLTISDLVIEFHYESTNPYEDFAIIGHQFAGVTLKNCEITVDSTSNSPTIIFLLSGKNVILESCRLINNSQKIKGGVCWLKGDNSYDVVIKNSYLENTSNDEILAFYSTVQNKVQAFNCKLVSSTDNTKTTIMVSFRGGPTDVSFENCSFKNTSDQIEAAIRTSDNSDKNISITNCDFDITALCHVIIAQEKTTKVSAVLRNVYIKNCRRLSRRGAICFDIANLTIDDCNQLINVESSFLSSIQQFITIRNSYIVQNSTGNLIALSDRNGIVLLENTVIKGTDNIIYAANTPSTNVYNVTEIAVVNNSGTILNTFT